MQLFEVTVEGSSYCSDCSVPAQQAVRETWGYSAQVGAPSEPAPLLSCFRQQCVGYTNLCSRCLP